MPELPEVETMVRELRPQLVGRTVVSARLSHDNVLSGTTRRQIVSGLRGSEITALARRAKHGLIHTNKKILAVQPGMSGGLLFSNSARDKQTAKYDVLTCTLDNDAVLVYRDVRRIGTLRWLTQEGWEEYAQRLGPEPLDPALTVEVFTERLGKSKSPIKKVLMDQRYVVGVGNIYANEALFEAGTDPSKSANKVTAEQFRAMHHHMRRILAHAIDNEGTTFRDYVTSTGKPGGFQSELKVYGRAGEPCRACGTTLATTQEIDNRQTVFCWKCQD
jgi:formamidopyrimidine-DNA glycosylase